MTESSVNVIKESCLNGNLSNDPENSAVSSRVNKSIEGKWHLSAIIFFSVIAQFLLLTTVWIYGGPLDCGGGSAGSLAGGYSTGSVVSYSETCVS